MLAPTLLIITLTAASLEAELRAAAPDLPKNALRAALKAAKRAGLERDGILTLIDYSKPSAKRRMWVLDLDAKRVLFRELVAHGKGSDRGGEAVRFSNRPRSLASSLGLYRTLGTYEGKHGYSLKLRGLDRGVNDNAEVRAIVMHGAWYVSETFAKQHGRLGRSWGCPAVDKAKSREIIDAIKGGSLMFVYHAKPNP